MFSSKGQWIYVVGTHTHFDENSKFLPDQIFFGHQYIWWHVPTLLYDIVCNHLHGISMPHLIYMYMTNIPTPWWLHCRNPLQEVVWVKRPHPVLLPWSSLLPWFPTPQLWNKKHYMPVMNSRVTKEPFSDVNAERGACTLLISFMSQVVQISLNCLILHVSFKAICSQMSKTPTNGHRQPSELLKTVCC